MSRRTKVTGTRSFTLWLLIFIAVVLAVGVAAGALFLLPQIKAKQDLEKHYQAGVAFQNVGDWSAAEAEFKQVVALDAKYKDVQTLLAEVRAALAESAATATAVAIAQAEHARLDAQATATARAQATVEAQANAEATAAAAPTATAEALEAHYQKGLGYMNMERWEEAKAELEQVFEADPNYKDVQTKLAEVEAEMAKLTPTATLTPVHTPTPTAMATPETRVVYSNDFEEAEGPEWSNTSTDITQSGQRFLGHFSNDTVSLTLNDLPSHTDVTVSFDLLIIRSWDGNGPEGPDVWDLSVAGGQTLLHTTFTNADPSGTERQAYPGTYPGGEHPGRTGAAETNTLGFTFRGTPWDSVYRLISTFPHSASSLVLNFSGSGLQGVLDESWGIDNVEVSVTGQPETP